MIKLTFYEKVIFSNFFYVSINFYLDFILDSTMCGDPEQPVFSIVNRTSPSTVRYSCVKGHRMEGGTGSTRHCSDKGVWIGSPPKCVGKDIITRNAF